MDKILEVKNLKISFRTQGGTLKAVRDISFDLNRGETLAIVGESGSGKSVTSKAILGILAGNSIVEGGEILYDGKDLLKITEEEMCQIRGDKIAMIFQDPLSALNPIVHIGKQITEAMLLKNKGARRTAKKIFRSSTALLKKHLAEASSSLPAETVKEALADIAAGAIDKVDPSAIAPGVEHSYLLSLEGKRKVLEAMPAVRNYFLNETLDKATALKTAKSVTALVNASIDRLETVKDSTAYTFGSSLTEAINKYFFAVSHNPKEEARFAKQSAKRDALIAKGRNVDWKVVPKQVYDLGEMRGNIVKILDNLSAKYEKDIGAEANMKERAAVLLDYLATKSHDAHFVLTPKMAKEKAITIMEEVGIPEPHVRFNQYPFQFSGGMRQRIVIAIALSANPDILICDEPTTALDVTIQAQILDLIKKLKEERNLSVIFITHDLGVVANIADKIGVMYAGKIVELGSVDDIFYDPRHPYTWALLSSMPDLDTEEKLEAIPGTPPNMIYPPEGDAFAARNKYALKIDFEQQPPKFAVSDTHWATTWLLHPDAPKAEPPHIITERIERMTKRGGSLE